MVVPVRRWFVSQAVGIAQHGILKGGGVVTRRIRHPPGVSREAVLDKADTGVEDVSMRLIECRILDMAQVPRCH